jgi:hypothetical protein
MTALLIVKGSLLERRDAENAGNGDGGLTRKHGNTENGNGEAGGTATAI